LSIITLVSVSIIFVLTDKLDLSSELSINVDSIPPYYVDIPIFFTASLNDTNGYNFDKYEYEWDFGEGPTQNIVGNQKVSHTYTEGFYKKVSLTVSENDNVIGTDEMDLEISPITYISQFGHYGSDDKEFHVANGIATNSQGDIYVVDQVNNRINIFDSDGDFLDRIGDQNDSEQIKFNSPHGITIDGHDNIYIADLGNNRIVVLDSDGKLKFEFGSFCSAISGEYCYDPDEEGPLKIGDGQFHAPYGITLDSQNNIYVTDVTSSFVQKFDANGKFLKKWGGLGSSNNQLISPHGIGIDDDDVYVVDQINNRVQVFDSDGNWIYSFVNDSDKIFFDLPRGLTIYKNIMYVTNGGTHHNIVAFNLTGVMPLFEFGSYCNMDDISECRDLDGETGRLHRGDMQFDEPHDVTISNDGKIFVTDGFNHRVQIFAIKE